MPSAPTNESIAAILKRRRYAFAVPQWPRKTGKACFKRSMLKDAMGRRL